MKLAEYMDVDKLAQHIRDGYVMERHHKEWPLVMYTYARRCQYENYWDDVTERCRGVIFNKETQELVARPFEKFHNIGTTFRADTWPENFPKGEPAITKKLDGNLITLYPWEGHWYAASKGSFHSEHADWANEWLAGRRQQVWPLDHTPVLEMIAEEVQHHVVHYGNGYQGLHALAVINNETGEELSAYSMNKWAMSNGLERVLPMDVRMDYALKANNKNEEGYVLAWPRPGRPPFRVKVKFIEFLRLQKLLHNTGPKQILDMLRHEHLKCYLDEALDVERSTPEFVEWVRGWMVELLAEYTIQAMTMDSIYKRVEYEVHAQLQEIKDRDGNYANVNGATTRKAWALRFTAPENRTYAPALFARLDGDLGRAAQQIWKLVEPLTEGNRPFTTDEE